MALRALILALVLILVGSRAEAVPLHSGGGATGCPVGSPPINGSTITPPTSCTITDATGGIWSFPGSTPNFGVNYQLNWSVGGNFAEATSFCYSSATAGSSDYWTTTYGSGAYPNLWFYLNPGPNNILQAINCGTPISEVAHIGSTGYKSLVSAIANVTTNQTITLDSLPARVAAYYDGGVITTNGITLTGASPSPLLAAFNNSFFQGIISVVANNVTINNVRLDNAHGGGGIALIKEDDNSTGFTGTGLTFSDADAPFQTGGNTGLTTLTNVLISKGGCCGLGQDHNLYMSTQICGNVSRSFVATTGSWSASSNQVTVASTSGISVGNAIQNGSGTIPDANHDQGEWIQAINGNVLTIGPFNTTGSAPAGTFIQFLTCNGKTAADIDYYNIDGLTSINVQGNGWLFKQRDVGGVTTHNTACATNSLASCLHNSVIACTAGFTSSSDDCWTNGSIDYSCGGDHILSHSVIENSKGKPPIVHNSDGGGYYIIKFAEEATTYPLGCQLYSDVPVQSLTMDSNIFISDMGNHNNWAAVVCLWHVGDNSTHCNQSALSSVACTFKNNIIVSDPTGPALTPGDGCGYPTNGTFCTPVAGKCTDANNNRWYQDRITAATNEGWLNTSFTDPVTGVVTTCTVANSCAYPYLPGHL